MAGVPTEWLMGLAGGLMVGGAAAAFLLGLGRIMGASGIIDGLVDPATPARKWGDRLAFVVGLAGFPLLMVQAGVAVPAAPVVGWPLLVLAGLLVGFGSRLGSGCTSGHGVCGISRLAPRGIVATIVYMATGIATVTAMRLIWGI